MSEHRRALPAWGFYTLNGQTRFVMQLPDGTRATMILEDLELEDVPREIRSKSTVDLEFGFTDDKVRVPTTVYFDSDAHEVNELR